jgi:hypothetical protein
MSYSTSAIRMRRFVQGGCTYSPSAPLTTKHTDNSSGYDHNQTIGNGDQKVATYKPGLAKLLAARNVDNATNTNNNYVYFAISRFMQKRFGVYPPYPRI